MIIGAVQKGPFERGSEVSVIAVSGEGRPQGWIHRTETTDDLGRFAAPSIVGAGVMIEGIGRFYDELKGRLSLGALRLRAVHALGSKLDEYNVNVFTHITSRRILAHVRTGSSVKHAMRIAENELLSALPCADGLAAGQVGAGMTLVAGRYRGFLLNLSAAAIMASRLMAAGTRGEEDSFLQNFLDRLSAEFAEWGELGDKNRSWLECGYSTIDPGRIASDFRNYLSEIGRTKAGLGSAEKELFVNAA